jgi:hypothetical protein
MEKTLSLEKELNKAIKKGCPKVNSCNYPVSLGEFSEILGFVKEYCGNGKHNQCPAAQENYSISARPSFDLQKRRQEERRKNGFGNSIVRTIFDFYKQNHSWAYR